MAQRMSRLLCVLLVSTCAVLFAQSDRGVITGTVSDATGAIVPGARITAVHTSTNTTYSTASTSSGDFTVPSLPVGNYTLRVEKEGFKVHLREKVVLAAAGVSRVDVQLELGSTQQTVEVTATLQMLQSETARLQSQVASRLVEELPLVVGGTMRSPFDLAAITPDVTISGTNVTIAGGTSGHYGITLDGVSAATGQDIRPDWVQINTPSVDAITEFAVDSGAPKAEVGHATGGQITFVSKSGTNQFHGTAYEFLRNNALDARSFFEAKKRVYKQHDFGLTAGGPVWIPKLYNGRDKTFFFVSYEGFRNRVGDEPSPSSVPPPEFFTGDLRNWVDRNNKLIQIYNPRTLRQEGGKWVRDPFSNNQIPSAMFDPASKSMFPYGSLAKPNVPGLVPGTSAYVRNNYVPFGGVALTPFDKTSFKIDHYLSGAHRLAFYFGRTTKNDVCGTNGCTGLPGVLSGFQTGFRTSDVYRLSWDYTVSPRLLNRFYAGGNNWREDHWSIAQDTGRWKDKVCMKNVEDCDENLPQITFSEFSQWVGPATNGSDNIVVDFNDDMTFISGPHTFKWGYAYDNNHYNGKGEQNIAGTFGFNRLSTSVPLDTLEASGGGSAFAAFLLGEAYSGGTDTRRFVGREYRYHAGFFQDDWRVNSRLTLNLGMRYEVHMPPLDGKDEMSDLDPKLPNPAADGIPGAMIFAGFGPGRINSRTMTPTWWGGLGPRVGLAYSLNRSTVVRSSFTRSFGPVHGGPRHADGFTQQWSITSTSQGLNRTFKLEEGLPPWPHPPFIDPSVSNGSSAEWYNGKEASLLPENLDWVFSIQRQLGGTMVAEAAYHGFPVCTCAATRSTTTRST